MAKAWIGTSGWHYPHWRGPVYPVDLPTSRALSYYAERFRTVEINNSFYRLPSEATMQTWAATAPHDFVFAVKASRFLTHAKKLKDPQPALDKLLPVAEALGKKLGPILFQLPPKWKRNVERLEEFLSLLPRSHRYAFEFREPTWHHPDIYAVLRKYNSAFCIFEIAGLLSPFEVTARWVYVRLHGPGGKYQGSYMPEVLRKWAERVAAWRASRRDVYFYFDNDDSGYAFHNALALRDLVEGG